MVDILIFGRTLVFNFIHELELIQTRAPPQLLSKYVQGVEANLTGPLNHIKHIIHNFAMIFD